MSEQSGSKTLVALLAGVVVGAAVGVAVGMLLAPEKGAETRNKVKSKLEDLEVDVLSKVDEIIDQIGKKKDEYFQDDEVVEEKTVAAEAEDKTAKA